MGVDERDVGREPVALDGSGISVGIACGRFNDVVTVRLLAGVIRGLLGFGVAEDAITIEWVPGAFEVPFAAQAMLRSGRIDAAIGLGCVIRGETSHYDFVAGECARGLQDVGLSTGKPAVFGVLTTENLEQAFDRSQAPGGHNVGEECARTALEMVLLARRHRV